MLETRFTVVVVAACIGVPVALNCLLYILRSLPRKRQYHFRCFLDRIEQNGYCELSRRLSSCNWHAAHRNALFGC